MAALQTDWSRSRSTHLDRRRQQLTARKLDAFRAVLFVGTSMTLSRDWLAVIAAAVLILLVKLGIASGIPW